MRTKLLSRRTLLLLLPSVLALPARAGEVPYDKAGLDVAIGQRRSFIVAFVTDWCSTCKVQDLLVKELLAEPRFAALTLFVADFDKEAELRQRMRVVRQSTFVVFRDGREVARSTGETRKDRLAALFAKAL